MKTNLLRAGTLACALMTSTCLTAPALAQTTFQQQERPAPDGNGVDVISGHINVPVRSVSVGGAGSGLTYVNGWADGRFYDTFSVQVSGLGTNPAIISIFGEAKRFTPDGSGGWTNLDADGATFVTTGSGYVYTARDGTVFTFLNSLGDTGFGAIVKARISTIQRPDGEIVTYHHRIQPGYQHCDLQFHCVFVSAGGRVQSATSNLGFQLKPTYASDVWQIDGTSNADFGRVTSVAAINNGVDYCDPDADSCSGLTQTWPQLTLGVSTGGSTTTHTYTDVLGNTTTVLEGASGVTSVTSPASSTADLSVTYDANGRVATFARGGGTWTYTYADALVAGANQRTTTVAQPLGGNRVYVSNLDTRRVLSATDELGHTTGFQYDAYGRVTRTTLPEGNYNQLTYDARGNVTEARRVAKSGTGLADIVATGSFPVSCTNPVTCNLPTSITDARLHTTDYTYDPTHGGVLTVTAPAPTAGAVRPQARYTYGQRSAWYKNSAGAIVQAPSAVYQLTAVSACQTLSSCAGGADEVRTTLDYGIGSSSAANGLLVRSVSSGSGDGALTATVNLAYDAVGNVTSVDGPLAGTDDTSGFTYDAARRLTISVSPDPDGAGSLPRRAQRTTYNGDGNVNRIEAGTATSLTGSFTPANNAERTEYGYDDLGRLVTETLVSGPLIGATRNALTQYSYDTKGRLGCMAVRMNPALYTSLPTDACTLQTAGTSGPDRIVRNVYDNADRTTQFQTGYATPDAATEMSATYRSNGQAETLTDAEGNMTTYEYDGHDRLVKTRYPSPTTDGTSSTTDYVQPGYDANDNLTSLRLRDGQNISFGYDNLDRMTLKNLPGTELDVSYSYDLLNRITSAATSAQTLSFGYDALSRNLTQAGPLGTANYQYDLAGQRTRLTWPGSGLYADYDYNPAGDVTAIRENGATSGVGVLATYTYDTLGRRASLTRGNGTATTYSYDNASRLAQLVQNLTGTTSDLTLGFGYNPASQITSNTRDNNAFSFTQANTNVASTVNGLNQLTATGGSGVSHDARGNLSAIGSASYGYSSENLMTSAPGSTTLGYDPMTRLYQTAGGGTTSRFAYDDDEMIAEYNSSNALQRRYVFGPGVDEPLVWYEGSGTATRRWFHTDERGSVVAVSDASGNLYGSANRYDEYGNPQGTLNGRFGYTGQAWLPEIGMFYYRARIYNPTIDGRFMQTDPLGYDSGMNLYAYVLDDPIDSRDPSGMQDEPPCCVATGTPIPGNMGTGGTGSGFFTQPTIADESTIAEEIVVTAIRVLRQRRGGGLVSASREALAGSPRCVGQPYSDFFAHNLGPASAAATAHGLDVTLPLGLSAHESSYGTSRMARTRNNVVGSTPGGDSTAGLGYSSISAGWQAWDSMWGARLNGVGSDTRLFTSRLVEDNQRVIGAVDHRGPYNTEVAPGGDPNWRHKVTGAISAVRARLAGWLSSRC